MIIAAKLSRDIIQIKDRKSKGANYVELHTNPSEFEEDIDELEYRKIFDENEMKIISVHSPMKNKYNNGCGVGYKPFVSKKEYYHNIDIIKRSILLASKIIDSKQKIVVIHLAEIPLSNSTKDINVHKKAVEEDVILLSKYASEISNDIILAFENNVPIYKVQKDGSYIETAYGSNCDYVKWIRDLNLNNVGVTLDICHALGSIEYGNKTNKESTPLNISEYIINCGNLLKHIHLSNSRNFSLKEGHGIAFNNSYKDISILKEIKLTLEKINYKYNIVIETIEKDVNKYENYVCIIKVLESFIENFER